MPTASRTVRVERTLWESATRAAVAAGYRDLSVYVEDALRALLNGQSQIDVHAPARPGPPPITSGW